MMGWMAGWLDEQPHPAQVIVDVRWIYMSLIANRRLNRQLLKDGGPPLLRCSN
jgi:hypothetical protein